MRHLRHQSSSAGGRSQRRLGLITVEERRRRGQKSLTNLVRIISAEWLTWLRNGGGFRKANTTRPINKQHEQSGYFGASWQRYYRHYEPGNRATGGRGP
jgi:hypothetical protein